MIYVQQNPAARLDPTLGLQDTVEVDLVAGTQLLSNGPIQSIDSQQGSQLLPFSGVDTRLERLPQILGTVEVDATQFRTTSTGCG